MAYLTSEARRKQRKALWLIIEIICLVHFAIIVPRDRVLRLKIGLIHQLLCDTNSFGVFTVSISLRT